MGGDCNADSAVYSHVPELPQRQLLCTAAWRHGAGSSSSRQAGGPAHAPATAQLLWRLPPWHPDCACWLIWRWQDHADGLPGRPQDQCDPTSDVILPSRFSGQASLLAGFVKRMVVGISQCVQKTSEVAQPFAAC